jgi:hypothetical protein
MASKTGVDVVEERVLALIRSRPVNYYDILREFRDEDYRAIMLAFGHIRRKHLVGRDDKGRYTVAEAQTGEGAKP